MIAKTRTRSIARFTDIELFEMFNVELDPTNTVSEIRCPLWSVDTVSQPRTRARTPRLDGDDTIRDGVSRNAPGSRGRVADLAAFYASHADAEQSPFNI